MRPRRSEASTIWSTIYANRSPQISSHLPRHPIQCNMGSESRLRCRLPVGMHRAKRDRHASTRALPETSPIFLNSATPGSGSLALASPLQCDLVPVARQRPNMTPPRRSRLSSSCLPWRPWRRSRSGPSRFSWRSWWTVLPKSFTLMAVLLRSRPGPSGCPWQPWWRPHPETSPARSAPASAIERTRSASG